MDGLNAPLYSRLAQLNALGGLRFHMPGHKGKAMGTLLDSAMAIDYTEIPQTGNLYDTGGIIQQAEGLAARYWCAGQCFFLTCGATQGIKAALAAFAGSDQPVVLDRNSHQSAADGCVLLDLKPTWVWPQLQPSGLSGPIDPSALDRALSASGARAAMVTSPTYYGHLLDIEALAAVAHARGAALIVDAAHGSHLVACGVPDPVSQGADAVVYSAHKTLTALGQGAYLMLASRDQALGAQVRRATALFGTTSPSYPIMASLDYGRALLETRGDAWRDTVSLCQDFVDTPLPHGLEVRSPGPPGHRATDPCRLTIDTASAGLTGFEAADLLRRQAIEPEMADPRHVVCIVTPQDTEADLRRLRQALEALPFGRAIAPKPPAPLPHPVVALTPRQARFAPTKAVPLMDSVGHIAAQSVAPYPPGVPVITPGEVVDKFVVEVLLDKGYNKDDTIYIFLS